MRIIRIIVIVYLCALGLGCARDRRDWNHVGDAVGTSLPTHATGPGSNAKQLSSAVRHAKTQLISASKVVSREVAPPASHHKIWRPEYAVLPVIQQDGWQLKISNVRDSRYRSLTDYDVRYYDLTFALTDIQTVDFIVVPFQKTDFLAHTMLSFGLRSGQHFVVSVEARLEKDEAYSTAAGMRRQFELMYVIGDERDLILLRTKIRNVDCFLYPGRAQPEDCQRLFVDIMERVNEIAKQPEYYHTLTNNCTTNLVDHVNNVFPDRIPARDWRLILPGRSDRLAFELGLLNITAQDFEAVRNRYRINSQANTYELAPDFSERIRQLL